jgi:hypothetical protein
MGAICSSRRAAHRNISCSVTSSNDANSIALKRVSERPGQFAVMSFEIRVPGYVQIQALGHVGLLPSRLNVSYRS